MDLSSAMLLTIIVGMIISFFRQEIALELTASTGLVLLVIAGFLSADEAFSGFSSPVTITLVSMFALGAALSTTGITDRLASIVFRLVRGHEKGNIALVMLLGVFFSSFMNNVAAAALLLPVVGSISIRTGLPQSRLLMPLSFATLLGGMCTLIGTPPNLVGHDTLKSHGFQGFTLFEFLPFGLGVSLVGICYMVFCGYKKLPIGKTPVSAPTEDELPRLYGVEQGLFAIKVKSQNEMAGATLAELGFGHDLGLVVANIYRAGKQISAPGSHVRIHGGDILLVSGKLEQTDKLASIGELISVDSLKQMALSSDSVAVFEVVLSPRSELLGKTLQEVAFRERYNCQVLSILRKSAPICSDLSHTPLEFGDALLLQGPREKLTLFQKDVDFLVLTDVRSGSSRRGKAPFVILALLLFFALVALQIQPVHVAAFIAALIVLLSGALSTEEFYRGMSWRVVLFVAAILPLGLAAQSSGFPEWLSHEILQVIQQPSPLLILAAFCVLGSIFSQLIEPSLAIILLAPVVIDLAERLNINPQPLVMGLTLGSSIGFQSPFSQRANLLVMAAGGYSVKDYIRVGLPLSLLATVTALVLITLLYGISF